MTMWLLWELAIWNAALVASVYLNAVSNGDVRFAFRAYNDGDLYKSVVAHSRQVRSVSVSKAVDFVIFGGIANRMLDFFPNDIGVIIFTAIWFALIIRFKIALGLLNAFYDCILIQRDELELRRSLPLEQQKYNERYETL